MRSAIVTILCAGCLASVSFVDAMGQKEVTPGYIITNSLDTIYGNIISTGNDICRFDDGEMVIERRPGEIYGFRFNEGKFFLTKTVAINGLDRTIFLEYLLNGIASVYYLRYQGVDYYYVEKDGLLHELTNEDIVRRDQGMVLTGKSNRFKGILISLLADCPEIIPEIETSTFSRKSMVEVTRKYHQYVCTEYECIVYEKEFNKVTASAGPIFQSGYSSYRLHEMPSNYGIEYLNRHSGSSQFNFGMGVRLRVDLGTKKRSTFFNISSLLVRENFYMEDVQDYVREDFLSILDSRPVVISNSVTFNIGPKEKRINPYIGVGYGVDIYKDKDIIYKYYHIDEAGLDLIYEEDPRFLSSVHSAILTGGVRIPAWQGSHFGAELSLRRKYGLSYGILIMSGWGGNLSLGYFF